MGNEQEMDTNQPTLNRLNKSHNFGCKNAKSNTEIKKKKKKKALGTKSSTLGYKTSSPWVGIVQTLGTKRPNHWVRIVQPGYESSWVRKFKGTKRL